MGAISIPVTLTIAAACALINLWLVVRVGRVRMSQKVSVGDGGNELVLRRMRAQANFVENAPFALILIAGLELTAGTSWWLWAAGWLFVAGRLAHPFGMDGMRYGRMIGTATAAIVLAGLAIWAVVLVYQAPAPVAPKTFEVPVTRG